MIRKIAPCFFAIIIDALGFGLVYPVMAVIFTAADSPVLAANASESLRHFYLGLGYMLYPLCMFFGASFMGDLSDRWGRKKVLLLCMGGISLSFALMAAGVEFGSLMFLMIGRALSGLMAGSQPIAQASIADLSTPETKAVNMGLISLSYGFGAVIGPLVGGLMSDRALLSWFNFSTPFWVAACLAALAFLWLLLKFGETAVINQTKRISLLRPLYIFIEASRHSNIRQLAAVFLLMQIGFSIYFQFIIIYMQSAYQYTNWQMGTFQGMLGVGFAMGLLAGIPFATKRFTIKKIAVSALVLMGIAQLIAAFIYSEFSQWILVLWISFWDILAFSALLTLFSNAVDQHSQGWAMGISSSVMAIAWALTGLCSNFLNVLNVAELIAIGAIFILLSGGLLVFYQEQGAKAHVLS